MLAYIPEGIFDAGGVAPSGVSLEEPDGTRELTGGVPEVVGDPFVAPSPQHNKLLN